MDLPPAVLPELMGTACVSRPYEPSFKWYSPTGDCMPHLLPMPSELCSQGWHVPSVPLSARICACIVML